MHFKLFNANNMACIRKTTVFCVIFLALYAVFSQVEAYNECYSDSGCSGSLFTEYCCERKYGDNVCQYSCVGQSCTFNSDCAPDECCDSDDTCTKQGNCDVIKGLAGWIVAVIVISVIVVIVIPIAVVVFCCCCAAGAAASSRRHGGVIVAQPATAGTTVIATQQQQQQLYPAQQGQPMYFQNPQPYPNQPPPYQPQGTVYPPEASGPPMAMTPQVKQ